MSLSLLLLFMFSFLILIFSSSRRMWAQGINDWDSWTQSSPMSLWDVGYYFEYLIVWIRSVSSFSLSAPRSGQFIHPSRKSNNFAFSFISKQFIMPQYFPSEAHDELIRIHIHWLIRRISPLVNESRAKCDHDRQDRKLREPIGGRTACFLAWFLM